MAVKNMHSGHARYPNILVAVTSQGGVFIEWVHKGIHQDHRFARDGRVFAFQLGAFPDGLPSLSHLLQLGDWLVRANARTVRSIGVAWSICCTAALTRPDGAVECCGRDLPSLCAQMPRMNCSLLPVPPKNPIATQPGPSGAVESECELLGFEQGLKAVVASVRSPGGAAEISARYLVGGGSSVVRKAADIGFEGSTDEGGHLTSPNSRGHRRSEPAASCQPSASR
ncbi:hypothetical protein [Nocardia sp. NPDC052316]|uniref:hypothetical protein n=1 Tax=Nocardia sp. NPDC052316 TaxID=3364329 RepID=UPI0037C8EFA0